MGLLIVDQDKCQKDGLCAKECPMAIILLQDKESYPELVPGGELLCNLCGHCVAVCPHGALSHTQVPLADCPPLKKDLVINEEQAVQFLRSRRSIRFFKDRPVEKETIQKLIKIARYAPPPTMPNWWNGRCLRKKIRSKSWPDCRWTGCGPYSRRIPNPPLHPTCP